MPRKGVKKFAKRGRKGRNQDENPNANQVLHWECESSFQHGGQCSTNSSNTADKVKEVPKESVKRPKLDMGPEPVAGPSGLCGSSYETIIKTDGSMVICQYKPEKPASPSKPFQVKWGTKFLESLNPKTVQQKSILKSPETSEEKKDKQRTRFANTSVYYFERSDESQMRIEGDLATRMARTHFYTNIVPIENYEAQRQERFKRELAAISYRPRDRRTIQAQMAQMSQAGGDQQVILHTIQVPAELLEDDDIKGRRIKNVPKGCSCIDYCDPDLCECNLTGNQCHIIKEGYPCACKMEYCRNSNGRREFNSSTPQEPHPE